MPTSWRSGPQHPNKVTVFNKRRRERSCFQIKCNSGRLCKLASPSSLMTQRENRYNTSISGCGTCGPSTVTPYLRLRVFDVESNASGSLAKTLTHAYLATHQCLPEGCSSSITSQAAMCQCWMAAAVARREMKSDKVAQKTTTTQPAKLAKLWPNWPNYFGQTGQTTSVVPPRPTA